MIKTKMSPHDLIPYHRYSVLYNGFQKTEPACPQSVEYVDCIRAQVYEPLPLKRGVLGRTLNLT